MPHDLTCSFRPQEHGLTEGSPAPNAEQPRVAAPAPPASPTASPGSPPPLRSGWTLADAVTAARLPMAAAFVAVDDARWRVTLLALAAGTDLLDGQLARWYGGSRLGAFLDPVADKLFMASAFAVVALSGRLLWYEILFLLLRDLVVSVAFAVGALTGRAGSIPARIGGKAVTVCQVLALFAFLLSSPLLRPLAWATGAVAIYAIWDYHHVADRESRPLGG